MDQTVRILDIEIEKVEHQFEFYSECNSFDIDKDATTLAIAHDDGVSVWSIQHENKEIANRKTKSPAS